LPHPPVDQPTSVSPTKVRATRKTAKFDHLAERHAHSENRQEALLDEGLEESFPASDPVSAKDIS